MLRYKLQDRDRACSYNSCGLLPQGFCERKTPNLEATTFSALSVLLLIYDVGYTSLYSIASWYKQVRVEC